MWVLWSWVPFGQAKLKEERAKVEVLTAQIAAGALVGMHDIQGDSGSFF